MITDGDNMGKILLLSFDDAEDEIISSVLAILQTVWAVGYRFNQNISSSL